MKETNKFIATNRQAQRDYTVVESVECGIELKGSEVKSVRAGKINLKDSFARIENNQVILYNVYISPYAQASYLNVESTRPRRLLLHKRQIGKLATGTSQRGFTLVPLKAYFSQRGFVKIELALCKGKRVYDRRESLKRRESDLQIRRALESRRRK
ncbi:MAG: SsrA-binding protein SmpB [Candidatus Omnitrophica bacterium]|nr:SsrA-binding protein SmpB [Candidatus Omnitrophota bacterium]MBU4473497.1 SsrA-binding protein SmpB [Candidatus Omnitrophota bacterium]MCG2706952.1 SsrA-binding protein SmpB [Candidatus Omnitrophota bacterium]